MDFYFLETFIKSTYYNFLSARADDNSVITERRRTMEKTYCDKCGKDITKEKEFSVSVWQKNAEEQIKEADLCDKCVKEFLKFFPKK